MRVCVAVFAALSLSACAASGVSDQPSKVYPPGQPVRVGSLAYEVTEAKIIPRLGEDSASARYPQDRFYLVQISVTNDSGTSTPIPGLTLVDDGGKAYNELTDGTGVQNWLGVVRSAGPPRTISGTIAFDAPARHYRLRLTDEMERPEISIDLPLDFAHEQIGDAAGTSR